jgi:hypothetical protein
VAASRSLFPKQSFRTPSERLDEARPAADERLDVGSPPLQLRSKRSSIAHWNNIDSAESSRRQRSSDLPLLRRLRPGMPRSRASFTATWISWSSMVESGLPPHRQATGDYARLPAFERIVDPRAPAQDNANA